MLGLLLMALMQNPPAPVGPLPSKNQLEWHARQYYAFVHFGPNTFTGEEWGHGTEDPNVFNPTALDARQWCRTFKEAGMTGVIITAKHHDGFALWQSRHTKHGVMSSKWRGGKGDVLKDLSEACKEYGLWMGVYLSPWDRNHPTYGTPEYNDTFVAMLEEVLTQYGDMKEVWFDGANGEGPNGKRQVYDWPRYEATVRKFAPNAVIFGDGGDVRWVGNEQGFVGETNWNFLPSGHWPGDQTIYHLLNSGDPKGDKYSPGECDVSIRPGWFWRESENDKVKSLEQLQEIWYRSVGHGGNLLLNVPPDTRGLVHENDATALMEFRRWREAMFVEDLMQRIAAVPSAITDAPSYQRPDELLDGRLDTYLKADGENMSVTLRWPEPTWIDHVVLSEPIALGQRIDHFLVWTTNENARNFRNPFHVIASGTTVGNKRIVRLRAPVLVEAMMIQARSRSGPVVLSEVEAYLGLPEVAVEYAEAVTEDGQLYLFNRSLVVFETRSPGAEIRYTLDGTRPTEASNLYKGAIAVQASCNLRARAFYKGRGSEPGLNIQVVRFGRSDLWPATVFVREPDPGLRYSYFERGWQTLDQMKDLPVTARGVSERGLDLGLRKRDEHFAFAWDGVLSAPQDGVYTFTLSSDDGSRLWIDDKLVVENDGLHGMLSKQGVAPLAAGYHRVRVEYFNATGGLGLQLAWSGPGLRPGTVPASAFRH